MNVPSDLEAEECLLGACLLSQQAAEMALQMVTPGDFYRTSHSSVFAAIGRLWANGQAIDAVTVADELRSLGVLDEIGGSALLVQMQANTPATSSARRYAMIVAKHSVARQGMRIATEAVQRFADPTADVGALVDSVQAEFRGIDSPALGREPEDVGLDEFLARPPEQRAPWVVQNLLRRDWRVILVGREGDGKSTTTLQIGVCAAWGIHPFSHQVVPAASVLVVDLENPADVIHDRLAQIARACATKPGHATERHAALWHRPGGIDLRTRADRLAFEDVLRRRRPTLVVLGPVYKSYQRLGHESDEQVTAEVQRVLDDLRIRYGFALVMEHHAPKGPSGIPRDLVPFGSSLWLRWSELGFSLSPESRDFPSKTLEIESYRGDRVKHGWPSRIEWSRPFPWVGVWDDGIPEQEDF